MKHCLPTYLASFFFVVALTFGAGNSNLMAQITYPASITIPSSSTLTKSADNDSVTVGATLPYYTLPDLNFNPGIASSPTTYDATQLFDYTKIASSFTWSSAAAAEYTVTVPTGYTNLTNYRNITWNTVGSDTIKVNETSNSTYGGCTGSTSFIVKVINTPTAQFTNTGTLLCPSSSAVTLPLTLTSDMGTDATEKTFQLDITCDKAGTNKTFSPDLSTTGYVKATTSVTLTMTTALSEGIYTFTLNGVSDRISRKSSIAGVVKNTPSISTKTFKVYVVSPRPTLKTSAMP